MFAKKISNSEYDEKSKIEVLNMINPNSTSINNLNKTDIMRQKRLISLKEQAIKTGNKDNPSEDEKNVQELVDLHLKYDKILTEYRIIYIDYDNLKQIETKLNNKITLLLDELNETSANCSQLIIETETYEKTIKTNNKNYDKLQREFYMYKIRIISMITLVFSIFIAIYLSKYSYIW